MRVETLLLTNFLQLPFVIPDYQNQDEQHEKYTGGKVIDPTPGLYDSVIIVLDFNSLYPSIIREYNICFTTVPPTASDGNYMSDALELGKFIFAGQLPRIIGELVTKRQEVKKEIKVTNANLKSDPNNHELLLKL